MQIAVVGLGKLGLPLATLAASKGHSVVGIDKSVGTITSLNNGISRVDEPGLQELLDQSIHNMKFTTDFVEAKDCEMAIIIVPTPTGSTGGFVSTFVSEAAWAMANEWKKSNDWKTFVIASTLMPGQTHDVAELISWGMSSPSGEPRPGQDFGLVYSPEFIALGTVLRDMQHPDMVLIGADDSASRSHYLEYVKTIVQQDTPIIDMSIVDAEIAKISINTYLDMKIAYANNLSNICEGIPGSNAVDVLKAVGVDSRIGGKFLLPGGPPGGPCLPRDGVAFCAMAKAAGVDADLAAAAEAINDHQIERILAKLVGYSVVILGLTYKVGSSVTEMSLGSRLWKALADLGQSVAVSATPNIPLDIQELINENEAVVIATPYPQYAKYDFKGKFVVDPWRLLEC